ncbi:unnamed protein product [Cyprideis torosa]|uniref:Proline dehydrogenase n=1 Tax=Cyprideis torosa TaxID=163714 RepID=A0A7R8WCH1_9CRUS|nr:unnamed protein product [Cyprideis torosa]CAG0893354.1 unnamed protein product [Cyprideis torosa]
MATRLSLLRINNRVLLPHLECCAAFKQPRVEFKSNQRLLDAPSTTKAFISIEPIENPAKDKLDLTFTDHEAAFKSKTNFEILRGWLVFTLCKWKWLVDNNAQIMKICQKVFGKTLFEWSMRMTFYGHFVVGEDEKSIQPMINRMATFGVKSILDYSAEEDVPDEKVKKSEPLSLLKRSRQPSGTPVVATSKQFTEVHGIDDVVDETATARTYFYQGEQACDKHLQTFLHCIDCVSNATYGTGFAAVKYTALLRPQLLMTLSDVIMKSRRYLAEVGGVSGMEGFSVMKSSVNPRRILDKFEGKAKEELEKRIVYDHRGIIHLFNWNKLITREVNINDMFLVPDIRTGEMKRLTKPLTDIEVEMFENFIDRLHEMFSFAKNLDVRVMVDAEQSYFQPAISRVTMEYMNVYNRLVGSNFFNFDLLPVRFPLSSEQDKAIVFNTYQCYMKEQYRLLVADLEQAERQGFYFGAKLVRGAYMEQERARALALGYEDPICENFEETTESYHACFMECLLRSVNYREQGKDPQLVSAMVATHSEESCRFIIKKMAEFNIHPQDKLYCFGQLFGMCDQVSYPLGQAGYSVYKYVPYGKVGEVLPYLSRRAHENKGMLKKMEKERQMLMKEFLRRMRHGIFFHKPVGNYRPLN